MKRIYVAGAGYVGLVTAALYADKGNYVLLHDKNKERLARVTNGKIPILQFQR